MAEGGARTVGREERLNIGILLQAPVREYLRLIPNQAIGQVLNPFVVTALSVVVFLVWEEPARKWLRRTLASRMRNR